MFDKLTQDAQAQEKELTKLDEDLQSKNLAEQTLLMQLSSEKRIVDDTNAKINKLKELGRDGECPTCTRVLLDEYDNVINTLNTQVQAVHVKKIDELSLKLKEAQEQKKSLSEKKTLQDKAYQELSKKLNIIHSKQNDLQRAKEYFKQVEQKGLKNKEELDALGKTDYDAHLHVKLQTELDALNIKYKHVLSLETELKRLEGVKKELSKVTMSIEELAKTYKTKEQEFNNVLYDENAHKQKKALHVDALKSVDELTQNISKLRVEVASIEGQINTIQSSIDNNDTQLKKVQTKKDDLQDYEKIKTSLAEFKTKLNSKVAPRISSIASEMYAQITKGKYQHIEVSNDFDFFIYDEGKRYPIERFSGGEIDLANLVLRIAISKTLTELSGASSIGFLAFDEVFGSQDEARRMEILEAFHTIKEQYRQIFLISHEMEIKEMFERVVELN
jgi:exonuclease SbcC